jgi:hypothetical protein
MLGGQVFDGDRRKLFPEPSRSAELFSGNR